MKTVMEKVMGLVAESEAQGDVILSTSKSLKLSSQKGSISTYTVSGSQILGLRFIKDQRVGLAYTESLDDASLRLLVKQARENAVIAEESSGEQILDLEGNLEDKLDPLREEVSLEEKMERAIELETKVRELDPRVTAVPYNSYSEAEATSFYLSSKGRSTETNDRYFQILSSAVLSDEGKRASYHDYAVAKSFRDLDFRKVIETSLSHARALLSKSPLATGRYSVRFSPDCLQGVVNSFSNFFSAKAAMDSVNPWKDSVGETVMSPEISFVDDPLNPASFRISRFDDEGVARQKFPLIQDGVLRSLYHNSVTAQHFGTATTAHASRSAAGPLRVSGTNLFILGRDVKETPERFIEIIQLDGLHSGVNHVTGAFSCGIQGYLWERGERRGAVGDMTLSGNFKDLFRNVEVNGEELIPATNRSFFTAPLTFHEVSLAGK